MHNLRQDLVYGLRRMMRKNLGITLVMLVSMALDIGINTAVFSVVELYAAAPAPLW